MGNIDSIPVVSQVKSLVQVIGGDADGARRTQQKFSRGAPIVSQINSAVQSARGNNREARRIQEEFGNGLYDIAKSTPVVGHGIALGYGLAGKDGEAKAILNSANKGAVVGVVGGTVANGAKGVKAIAIPRMRRKARRAMGFKAMMRGRARGGKFNSRRSKFNPRFKRSVEEISNFDLGKPDLPNDLLARLPGSFNDLTFNNSMPATSMIDTVLSVFLVTQLMKIRHPRSNPFFQEICFSSYPALPYDDCLTLVLKSLHKFDGTTDAKSDSIEFSDSDQITHSAPWPLGPLALRDQTVTSSNFFIDLLETVELELESLTSENLLGYIMESATCNNSDEKIDCHELFKALKSGLKGIKEQVNAMQL